MAGLGSRDDLAAQVIERGEQSDRAMPIVIVRLSLDMPGAQRQARLGAFQCLALAFLIAAKHQRLVGRSAHAARLRQIAGYYNLFV